MPVSEYPMVSTSGSNPPVNHFTELPEKFSGAKTTYDDGGIDAALQHGGTGVRRWILKYEGLTAALYAIILSHFNTAKWLEDEGISAFTFNFRARDSGVLYTGCRYTKFEVSHTKTWINFIEVEITRFP